MLPSQAAAEASAGPRRAGLCCGCHDVLVEGGQSALPVLSVWGYLTHRAPRLNSQHRDGYKSAANLHQRRLLAGRFQVTCNHVHFREENPPQHLPGIFLSSSPSCAGANSPADFQAVGSCPGDGTLGIHTQPLSSG